MQGAFTTPPEMERTYISASDRHSPFYRRLPNVPGFGVEDTADKIGLGQKGDDRFQAQVQAESGKVFLEMEGRHVR